MVYIADLDVCRYHGGPFDPDNWSVSLRAVGWLEHPQPFTSGAVKSTVTSKLKAIADQTRAAYPQYCFRGVMSCSLCLFAGLPSPGPIWSQENIFVPGSGVVYVAPGGITHYIEAHSYLPPPEFVEAVLRCPDCGSVEYREALRSANNGIEPPLEVFKPYVFTGSKAAKEPNTDPPLTLAAAEEKFRRFLSGQNYPTTICWLMEGDLLIDKGRHFWVRERSSKAAKHAALRYSEGLERDLGVQLRAICSTKEQTFASVFVPCDDLDAQGHLMGRGLKLSCPTERYFTTTVKNPFHWLVLWLRYGRQGDSSQRFLFE